jgi:prolyl-tRNA synthetase
MLRGREFIMKDLYSFDKDVDSAMKTYDQVSGAYRKIFKELGIDVIVAEADSGEIGGSLSHEYHLLCDGKLNANLAGEDTVLVCTKCNFASNIEKVNPDTLESGKKPTCPSCTTTLTFQKAIEVGHTFFLDTKYSTPLESNFKSPTDTWEPFKMGCYGIGVSRLVAAIVEVSRDKDGIIWPESIAPYQTIVLATKACLDNLDLLQTKINREWVLDDRDLSMKVKMKEALMVGYPKIVIAGDRFLKEGVLEVHDRKTRAVTETKIV